MKQAQRRPRFVLALCLAAVAVCVFEVVRLVDLPAPTYRQTWFGLRLAGAGAQAVAGLHIAVCVTCAWGLWRLRPWARPLTMGYLGFTLASFVVIGVQAYHGGRVLAVMAWELLVLPFVTFCFMYLHGGERHFRRPLPRCKAGAEAARTDLDAVV